MAFQEEMNLGLEGNSALSLLPFCSEEWVALSFGSDTRLAFVKEVTTRFLLLLKFNICFQEE